MAEQREVKKINVTFPENLKGGVYSNVMSINHMREEFILDFLMVSPSVGSVTARIIMSPGHIKRTIVALQANLQKYESKFGKIEEAPEPTGKGEMGFHLQKS